MDDAVAFDETDDFEEGDSQSAGEESSYFRHDPTPGAASSRGRGRVCRVMLVEEWKYQSEIPAESLSK